MYERYVVRPKTRPKGALAFHNDAAAAPGTPLVLMNQSLVEDADVVINARLVEGPPPPSDTAPVDLHRHDVSQTYVLLSERRGTLTAELVIEGEKFSLASPVSAFIPAMARHSLRITGGPGTVVVLMPLKGDYNEHTFA